MARVSQVVCDRCGGQPADNALRISSGNEVKAADLCDSCAAELAHGVDLRAQAKRGRKAKR